MGPLTFACSLWCITHHPNTVGKPLQIIEFKKAYVCVVLHVRAELLELSLYGWRKRERKREGTGAQRREFLQPCYSGLLSQWSLPPFTTGMMKGGLMLPSVCLHSPSSADCFLIKEEREHTAAASPWKLNFIFFS